MCKSYLCKTFDIFHVFSQPDVQIHDRRQVNASFYHTRNFAKEFLMHRSVRRDPRRDPHSECKFCAIRTGCSGCALILDWALSKTLKAPEHKLHNSVITATATQPQPQPNPSWAEMALLWLVVVFGLSFCHTFQVNSVLLKPKLNCKFRFR